MLLIRATQKRLGGDLLVGSPVSDPPPGGGDNRLIQVGNFVSQNFDIYFCAIVVEVLQRIAKTVICLCKMTNKY